MTLGSVTSRTFGSPPAFPISRSSAQMHHSDDRNIIGLDLVYDPKRKPSHEASPDGAPHDRTTGGWMGKDFGQCAFGLSDEVCAQATGVSFIEPGGRDQLAFRQRMKDEAHRSAARAFLKTFPAGTPLTLPLFNSTERRSISTSHSRSASGSVVSSRLLIKLSARRARERAESFNASSSTFLRAMLIALPCIKN